MIIIDGDDGSGNNGAGIKIGRGISISENPIPFGEVTFDAAYFGKDPFASRSLMFSGASHVQSLFIPPSTQFDLTGSWTIELWIFLRSAKDHVFLSIGSSSRNANVHFYVGNNGTLSWASNSVAEWNWRNQYVFSHLNAVPVNTWVHLAAVREAGGTRSADWTQPGGSKYGKYNPDDVDGTFKMFVNGQEVTYRQDSNYTNMYEIPGAPILTGLTATNIYIGSYYNGNYALDGMIANFRWVRGLAVYTDNFTPPNKYFTSSIMPANPYGGSNTRAIPTGNLVVLMITGSIDDNLYANLSLVNDSSEYNTSITNVDNGVDGKVTYSQFGPFSASQQYATTPTDKTAGVWTANATYYWTVPPGVTSISVLAVGGGGAGAGAQLPVSMPGTYYTTVESNYAVPGSGGGGGALAYANNIAVVPGTTYIVQVGGGGGPKHFTQLLGSDWSTTPIGTGTIDARNGSNPGTISLNGFGDYVWNAANPDNPSWSLGAGNLQVARNGTGIYYSDKYYSNHYRFIPRLYITLKNLPFFLEGTSVLGTVYDDPATTTFTTQVPVRVYMVGSLRYSLTHGEPQGMVIPHAGWNPILRNGNEYSEILSNGRFVSGGDPSGTKQWDLEYSRWLAAGKWPSTIHGGLSTAADDQFILYRDFLPGTYPINNYNSIVLYFFDDRINPRGGDTYLTTSTIKNAGQVPLLFAGGGQAGQVSETPAGFTYTQPGFKIGLAGGGGGAGGYKGAGGKGFESGNDILGGAGGLPAGSKITAGFAGGAGGGVLFDPIMANQVGNATVSPYPSLVAPNGQWTTTIDVTKATGSAPAAGSGGGGGGGLNVSPMMEVYQYYATNDQYTPVADNQFVAWGGGGVGAGGLGPDGVAGPVTYTPTVGPLGNALAAGSLVGFQSEVWRSNLKRVSRISGSGGYEGIYDPNPAGTVYSDPVYSTDYLYMDDLLNIKGEQPAGFFNTPGYITPSKYVGGLGNTQMIVQHNYTLSSGAWYGGGGGGHYGHNNYNPLSTSGIVGVNETSAVLPDVNRQEPIPSWPAELDNGGGYGGPGVLRIVWPGTTRQFPNARVSSVKPPPKTIPVEVVAVAGGGAGGSASGADTAGGGGAGGLRIFKKSITVGETFLMRVGAGGAAPTPTGLGVGSVGSDTIIFSSIDNNIIGYKLYGGGAGGSSNNKVPYADGPRGAGSSGGSSGGGASDISNAGSRLMPSAYLQGNPGGRARVVLAMSGGRIASGGGGAGGRGGDGGGASLADGGSGGGSGRSYDINTASARSNGGYALTWKDIDSGGSDSPQGGHGGAAIGYACGGGGGAGGPGGTGRWTSWSTNSGAAGGDGREWPPGRGITVGQIWDSTQLIALADLSKSANSWGSFLNQYGVWNSSSNSSGIDITANIYFPTATDYTVRAVCDDLSVIYFVGNSVSLASNTSIAGNVTVTTSGQLSYSFEQTIRISRPGNVSVRMIGTNTGGPGSFGMTITGQPVNYYAGGGGSYAYSGNGGTGGKGGGGSGSGQDPYRTNGTSGSVNTGGGGGGGNTGGGGGGSGIVIIRYPIPYAANVEILGSATSTTANGYCTYTFTESGTFTFTGNVTPTKLEYLVVAGGGGGAANNGGGGGAGGFYSGILNITPETMTNRQINVTVGAGGASYTNGKPGTNSTLTLDANASITVAVAVGGGGGMSDLGPIPYTTGQPGLGSTNLDPETVGRRGDGGPGVSYDLFLVADDPGGKPAYWAPGGGAGQMYYGWSRWYGNATMAPTYTANWDAAGRSGEVFDTYYDNSYHYGWGGNLVYPFGTPNGTISNIGNGIDGRAGRGGGGGGGTYNPWRKDGDASRAGGAGGGGSVGIRYPIDYPEATVTGGVSYQVRNGYRIYYFSSTGTIRFN